MTIIKKFLIPSSFSMAELDIGKHCNVLTCKSLDFLPIKCDKCGYLFCKEHHFYDYHKCNKFFYPEASAAKNTTFIKYKCDVPKCESVELLDIKCSECSNSFCLQHRCQQDHNCEELLKRLQDKMPETKILIQSILKSSKIKNTESIPKKLSSDKARAMAAKINLMKMKQKASGDEGLPMDDRFYFSAICPSIKSSNFVFIDQQWTVGRTVDFLARTFKLNNMNNIQGGPKLVLCSNGDDDAFLDMSLKWRALLESQDLVNGSTLYLKTLNL